MRYSQLHMQSNFSITNLSLLRAFSDSLLSLMLFSLEKTFPGENYDARTRPLVNQVVNALSVLQKAIYPEICGKSVIVWSHWVNKCIYWSSRWMDRLSILIVILVIDWINLILLVARFLWIALILLVYTKSLYCFNDNLCFSTSFTICNRSTIGSNRKWRRKFRWRA